jgi:hypothetical protein
VQDTFTHLPDRLREYEQLSGHAVDVERVWYYRLFAETRLLCEQDPDAEERLVGDDIGNGIIHGVLHRRLTLEALARVMGIELSPEAPRGAVDEPAPTEWSGNYDATLGALRRIVPRIDDPLASQWVKGIARMVKYLKELDQYGKTFERQELDDIAHLHGDVPEEIDAARRRLADAADAGTVTDDDYVRTAWRRVQRDNFLLRTASGALGERSWPPLE